MIVIVPRGNLRISSDDSAIMAWETDWYVCDCSPGELYFLARQ